MGQARYPGPTWRAQEPAPHRAAVYMLGLGFGSELPGCQGEKELWSIVPFRRENGLVPEGERPFWAPCARRGLCGAREGDPEDFGSRLGLKS